MNISAPRNVIILKIRYNSLHKKMWALSMTHYKCRNNYYPSTNEKILRFPVPDEKVSWEVEWMDYSPPQYSSEDLQGKPWADPELSTSKFQPLWNELDGAVSRSSYHGPYKVSKNFPLNPAGRTGLCGRGILGRWGPNHAADPIVTRWKRNEEGSILCNELSKNPILQFVAIKRRDCGEWAIPGGMIDPGEVVSKTLMREFMEESLNFLELSDKEQDKITRILMDFFNNGKDVYRGYVDDRRNTDNAWMETVAQNFHDESGTFLDQLKLKAGDDAGDVLWMDISSALKLYSSHYCLLKEVTRIHNAHWSTT